MKGRREVKDKVSLLISEVELCAKRWRGREEVGMDEEQEAK